MDIVERKDFDIFYQLLMPGAWDKDKVTEENVDVLLVISDYYQAGSETSGKAQTQICAPSES